jgi:hypothetical protein
LITRKQPQPVAAQRIARLSDLLGRLGERLGATRPPARPDPELLATLRRNSHPLISIDRRLIVLFSAKSACSSTLIWFYKQTGLLEAARARSNWPHVYRQQVMNRGTLAHDCAVLGLDGFRILRVVRDPLSRSISSFRHALATGYADADLRTKLGLDTDARIALSFERWVDYLELNDLRSCNPHHRLQRKALEDLRSPDVVINVTHQDLYTELNRLEREWNWPVTDFPNLHWLQELHAKRDLRQRIAAKDASRRPLTRRNARSGPWPQDRALLRPDLVSRLRRLYRVDFEAYGG